MSFWTFNLLTHFPLMVGEVFGTLTGPHYGQPLKEWDMMLLTLELSLTSKRADFFNIHHLKRL
jgi:hypothetical protein